MKQLFLLLAFILISQVRAGTCTSISRTNSASLSVLTSSKYNTDLNTVYTAANAFDGGCITTGTLESDALNTTDFAPLLKGLQQGCKVIYSNASTIQIDKCIASVNGSFITTTTATNASFGCAGCSAEVATTTYYVYIQTGSSGSTLTPLILTTAPNNDGYDNSGNKVVGRFYNNPSSDIDQYSIDQWLVNKFVPSSIGVISWAPTGFFTTNVTYTGSYTRQGKYMSGVAKLAFSGATDTGTFTLNLPTGYEIDTSYLLSTTEGEEVFGDAQIYVPTTETYFARVIYASTTQLKARGYNGTSAANHNAVNITQALPVTISSGRSITVNFMVPIKGWGE